MHTECKDDWQLIVLTGVGVLNTSVTVVSVDFYQHIKIRSQCHFQDTLLLSKSPSTPHFQLCAPVRRTFQTAPFSAPWSMVAHKTLHQAKTTSRTSTLLPPPLIPPYPGPRAAHLPPPHWWSASSQRELGPQVQPWVTDVHWRSDGRPQVAAARAEWVVTPRPLAPAQTRRV